jgi:hypothetical protein
MTVQFLSAPDSGSAGLTGVVDMYAPEPYCRWVAMPREVLPALLNPPKPGGQGRMAQ